MQQNLKISYEFFPPKNVKMYQSLWSTLNKLKIFYPDFVSITYGAGGSTRQRTHDTIKKFTYRPSIKPIPHLTCIGDTKDSIKRLAIEYWKLGIKSIVVIRGDPENIKLTKKRKFITHPNGYTYASELIRDLKKIRDFDIIIAVFPEMHPESKDMKEDIDNLKRKIDLGATKGITQFFFDNNKFYEFINILEKKKVKIPIIPGILPIINFKKLSELAANCNSSIPKNIQRLYKDKKKPEFELSVEIATKQCLDLIKNGFKNLHFYTLNRADLTGKICSNLTKKRMTQKPYDAFWS
ncbi:MAG: 5,10-methylenetetrahydrofolate reductase [Alphaproteobacteria bacterium MarineAlpha6_Bin4]|nr:MAG: 5,10-methylenetetrahydrofolate reductase [Alphaproteobacteria bacterium MarineAlpha6_Bin4]|tara:strand:- start:3326 stop:4210 length:885 start_codon:yes stop_codon:yes gene_type:complete